MLWQGKDGIYFVSLRATVRGKVKFGRLCEVGPHTYLMAGQHGIRIGAYSQINPSAVVMGNVTIGDRTLIAPGVVIAAGSHRFGKGVSPRFSGGGEDSSIEIGDDVWIGANVNVVGNISIGHGSVVAAGVTIDTDVPPGTLVRRGTGSYSFEPIR